MSETFLYLALGFDTIVIVLLGLVIVKLHQVPAAVNLAKTGATTIVADMEAVIAKHKAGA